MRVQLNLATKALETRRRFLAGAGLVAVVGGLAFLGLGWHVYSALSANAQLRARAEKTRQEMAELETQRRELERYFSQKNIADLHGRADFINAIIDARSFNWTQMFMDLERVLPSGVRVISIEPKQEKGLVTLKLTVGAVSDDAKLKFLRALEDSNGTFTQVQEELERVPSQGSVTQEQKFIQLTTVYSKI